MESAEQENSSRRSSSSSEESVLLRTPKSGDTVAQLLANTPLVPPDQSSDSQDDGSQPSRRRSSLSILQTLANTTHLLATNDARKRNFLVGTSRHIAENDVSSFFPDGRSLTIMMATWNTGEASNLYQQNFTPTARETAQPKELMLEDMSDILLPRFIDYVSDLIIVCTQEMSVAKNRTDWEILLQEVIGPTHVLFHSIHFGTLSLCIFLRRDLIWFCTEPEEDIIKFRAVGPVRTKASLIITFNLFGTSFMIINSHFEAGHGPEGRANRKLNFQSTTTKLSVPRDFVRRVHKLNKYLTKNPSSSSSSSVIQESQQWSSVSSNPRELVDITRSCDCVLWAGDFNFRIDMTHQSVLEHCVDNRYDDILLKDEFREQSSEDGVYCNFKEAPIQFPPTYKYDLRSNADVYAKHRTPSYTDRILYRDKPTSLIECTQYQSVNGVKHSDHKPVVAHFRLKIKPGLHKENLSYGKFNHDVYKQGCKQRERHHSLGVGLRDNFKRRVVPNSSVCVLQ